MRRILPAVLLAAMMLCGQTAHSQRSNPFEGTVEIPANAVDGAVLAALREKGIEPAPPCSDAVFVRRVYLDVTGTLPAPRDVRAFLEDTNPAKRAALVDTLLESPEFADYWAMKWCDALRVKAEFPVNLWPNAVQAYHRWIRDAMKSNLPCDQFARELLTSSGSNFRTPPVNFYRAVQGRTPEALAGVVALTLMGERVENWPEARLAGMAAFFSRIAYKKTGEWKEEIVCLDPAADKPLEAVFPDGTPVTVPAGADPRAVFAEWLLAPGNPWFARNMANRAWAWLMGRGVVHEPDDIRPGNPPSNPALLVCLEKELKSANYDLRSLHRLILNSRTYQQSPVPRCAPDEAAALFASYPVRPLEAEVLADALCSITGMWEKYESPIPEPFTFLPEGQRAVAIADGSITSPFLEMFGRPARDTGLVSERNSQPNDAQRLHMLNSSHVRNKLEKGPKLRNIAASSKGKPMAAVRMLYLAVLSRYPTGGELEALRAAFPPDKKKKIPAQAFNDLAWALVNSKEFLCRH